MKKIPLLGLLAVGILALAAGGAASWIFILRKPLPAPALPKIAFAKPAPTSAPDDRTAEGAPGGELRAAAAETDSQRQDVLLENWADSIGVTAMEATIAQTDLIQNPALRTKTRAALLKSWCKRDVPGALTWFTRRGGADPLEEQARDVLARSLADRDATAMLGWMRNALPQGTQSELYSPFFRQWAQKSPAAAAAQLRLLADSSSPKSATPWNDILGEVAAQWAAENLTQALGWVEALPDGPGKSSALRQMSAAWTKAEPQAAAAYAMRQKDVELLQRIAGKWAENDPPSAASWAASLPAGSEQEAAVTRVATIWAEEDPVGAAAYAARLPSGPAQIAAALGVISMWAQSAPGDTAQWVKNFPEGATRDQAVGTLIRSWAAASASEAGQWIQSLPGGRSRDIAVAAFTSTTDVSSPAQAFQLAMTMSNPELRNQQLVTIANAWRQKDPTGAHDAIAQSNLSPELKNSLDSSVAVP